jgi:hypothetical protein
MQPTFYNLPHQISNFISKEKLQHTSSNPHVWLGAVPGKMPIFATIVATLVARRLRAIGVGVASPNGQGIKDP